MDLSPYRGNEYFEGRDCGCRSVNLRPPLGLWHNSHQGNWRQLGAAILYRGADKDQKPDHCRVAVGPMAVARGRRRRADPPSWGPPAPLLELQGIATALRVSPPSTQTYLAP